MCTFRSGTVSDYDIEKKISRIIHEDCYMLLLFISQFAFMFLTQRKSCASRPLRGREHEKELGLIYCTNPAKTLISSSFFPCFAWTLGLLLS